MAVTQMLSLIVCTANRDDGARVTIKSIRSVHCGASTDRETDENWNASVSAR